VTGTQYLLVKSVKLVDSRKHQSPNKRTSQIHASLGRFSTTTCLQEATTSDKRQHPCAHYIVVDRKASLSHPCQSRECGRAKHPPTNKPGQPTPLPGNIAHEKEGKKAGTGFIDIIERTNDESGGRAAFAVVVLRVYVAWVVWWSDNSCMDGWCV